MSRTGTRMDSVAVEARTGGAVLSSLPDTSSLRSLSSAMTAGSASGRC
jgi:hypothetical protein